MKRFLLLCVLFVACLAPCAAEGTVTVTAVEDTTNTGSGADLYAAINDLREQQIADITLTITAEVDGSNPVSSTPPTAIKLPWTDKNTAGFKVTINTIAIKGTNSGELKTTTAGFRPFEIGAGSTITFEDITLDGNNSGGGVTVTAGGSAVFKGNITLQKNKTAATGGGAVYADATST
ncbi:MAG: hypothetical protein IJU98_04145, partial [Synergistaceae bacterium]|nr:hypothetical protein [Synergistaceae bacterium]